MPNENLNTSANLNTSESLNIRHLRAFREVARCKSVSLAAKNAHLSQPAVTQAIGNLSKTLGVVLFERRSDGMFVSEIGAAFLDRVDRALEHLKIGARETARLGQRQQGAGFAHFDRLLTSVQLRALIATADASNFSMAARQIGISQPSLHRAARNLEQLCGVKLFNTAPQGVSLTLAARELTRRSKLAFAELKQGLDQVGAYLGRDSTHIVVGSLPLARTHVLPFAIASMIDERDGVQVRIVDGPYEELLHRLRQGDLDLMVGALRTPPPVDDIVQQPLFDDPLAIIVGKNHPLIDQKNLTLDHTLKYPWVAPPKPTPSGTYLFESLGIGDMSQTPVRVVSSSLALLRGLMDSGPFITIISLHQARHEISQKLFVPLPIDLPDSSRPIGMTFRADWRPTPTQERFVQLLVEAGKTVKP